MTTLVNPFKFDDPKAQTLSDKWEGMYETVTNEQRDLAGKTWLTEVIGLTDEEVEQFLNYDSNVQHKAGMVQAGIPLDNDVSSFWGKISEIFPETFSASEIEYLINKAGILGADQFIGQIDRVGGEKSPVIRQINSNAHVYK